MTRRVHRKCHRSMLQLYKYQRKVTTGQTRLPDQSFLAREGRHVRRVARRRERMSDR